MHEVYLPAYPLSYTCRCCFREITITKKNIKQKDISNGFFVAHTRADDLYVGVVCSKSCAVALLLLLSPQHYCTTTIYKDDIYIGKLNEL